MRVELLLAVAFESRWEQKTTIFMFSCAMDLNHNTETV